MAVISLYEILSFLNFYPKNPGCFPVLKNRPERNCSLLAMVRAFMAAHRTSWILGSEQNQEGKGSFCITFQSMRSGVIRLGPRLTVDA